MSQGLRGIMQEIENNFCPSVVPAMPWTFTALISTPLRILAHLTLFWSIYPKEPHALPCNLHNNLSALVLEASLLVRMKRAVTIERLQV